MAKITITAGSTVRYVGAQKPELAGVEGVVTDLDIANKKAHVFWAQHIKAMKQGRKQHEPTWEPAHDLKPLPRGFTKGFRQRIPGHCACQDARKQQNEKNQDRFRRRRGCAA